MVVRAGRGGRLRGAADHRQFAHPLERIFQPAQGHERSTMRVTSAPDVNAQFLGLLVLPDDGLVDFSSRKTQLFLGS